MQEASERDLQSTKQGEEQEPAAQGQGPMCRSCQKPLEAKRASKKFCGSECRHKSYLHDPATLLRRAGKEIKEKVKHRSNAEDLYTGIDNLLEKFISNLNDLLNGRGPELRRGIRRDDA